MNWRLIRFVRFIVIIIENIQHCNNVSIYKDDTMEECDYHYQGNGNNEKYFLSFLLQLFYNKYHHHHYKLKIILEKLESRS